MICESKTKNQATILIIKSWDKNIPRMFDSKGIIETYVNILTVKSICITSII